MGRWEQREGGAEREARGRWGEDIKVIEGVFARSVGVRVGFARRCSLLLLLLLLLGERACAVVRAMQKKNRLY